jgi:hypothetical protein
MLKGYLSSLGREASHGRYGRFGRDALRYLQLVRIDPEADDRAGQQMERSNHG